MILAPIALSLLCQTQAESLPETPPDYINDRAIKEQFSKVMGDLLDDEKTIDPKELREQLQAESTCTLELPESGDATPLTTAAVYRDASPSVLCLGNIYNCGKCHKWHGSLAGGVVLTADGIAVTNYHVMASANADAFGAITRDGQVFPVTKVLAASKKDDVAIVQLDATGLTPASLSINDPVGTSVCAITHPNGRFYSLTTGIISRYYTPGRSNKHQAGKRVTITADFAKGSSGSGIFNQSGQLTAIVTSTNSIYYNKEEGDEKNLQMVIKDCVPAASIRALIENPGE